MLNSVLRTGFNTFLILFFSASLLFASEGLMADAGPKPSMKFSIEYKTTRPVEVSDGWQLQSEFGTFNVFDTLERKGAQGFHVINREQAKSTSYGYRDYQKLILKFNDTVRESNVFVNESFNSTYQVTVYDDWLEIIDTTSFMKDSSVMSAFIKALLLTLVLELLVAFIYLKLARKPLRILLFVIIGNLITLPFVWFLFPLVMDAWAILAGEIFAFITEAFFLKWTCDRWFKLSGAFLLSFMMNVMSLLIGGFALILMIGF
jgi:hypothetical protein